ncbi:hypothetical protein [Amycolatopsis cihanbeyliensis]|uniref:Uncharacterized protein n=1 Tax=Amycolatopsis cihanbeyliensis TaxID=1128664 RepID=A0A542CUL0_AMYCI|nr:hypothetical protein [Amycolatopsis cihanbeyliensis]TQI94512.1 hypothetical protein FB471_6678 [Amycolatopsis cihanbeyliensis]
MRKGLQVLGLYLVLAGISGTIDYLAGQPLLGAVLNVFNRFVIPRIDLLAGYEIYANLSLAVFGAAVLAAAVRVRGT